MWQRNNGQSESDIIQNRYTAYLATAIVRRRNDYIEKVSRLQVEYITDAVLPEEVYILELEVIGDLPIEMQLENTALLRALKELGTRERHVFLSRVLDDKSFEDLAEELNISYKGVAAIYYRAILKIKKRMGGEKE